MNYSSLTCVCVADINYWVSRLQLNVITMSSSNCTSCTQRYTSLNN